MLRLGTMKALLMMAALCAACGVVPAQAASKTIHGQIGHAWVSPTSGEALNGYAGPGTFGYTVIPEDVDGSLAGRCFYLSAPDATTDLDIYFYVGADPTSPWDYSEGVNSGSGPERGRIPAGATHAFVMISYFNAGALDVGFDLRVFDGTTC